MAEREAHVYLEHEEVGHWACPECGAEAKPDDHQAKREWRHLDTCQYRTILHARPPAAPGPKTFASGTGAALCMLKAAWDASRLPS